MATYRVLAVVPTYYTYLVEAGSEDEALRQVSADEVEADERFTGWDESVIEVMGVIES